MNLEERMKVEKRITKLNKKELLHLVESFVWLNDIPKLKFNDCGDCQALHSKLIK